MFAPSSALWLVSVSMSGISVSRRPNRFSSYALRKMPIAAATPTIKLITGFADRNFRNRAIPAPAIEML